jgi:hypothetical protein
MLHSDTATRTIHPDNATTQTFRWLKLQTTNSNVSTAEENILLETANIKKKSEILARNFDKTQSARPASPAPEHPSL